MSTTLCLRVLGPVEVTGAGRPLSSQQVALIAYLACVGPASRQTLVEALWAGQPISDGRFANLISDVRRAIGRHHLPELRAGRYRLRDLPTDLDLLLASAPARGRASSDQSAEAPMTTLEAAVELVRGPVFATPPDRSWWWLDGHPEVVAQAEAAVGRAAHRLVRLLWEAGELDRARQVCQRVLASCPLDRDLVMALEGLHRAQGRPGAAHRLLVRWRLQVERLTGEDPLADSGTLMARR